MSIVYGNVHIWCTYQFRPNHGEILFLSIQRFTSLLQKNKKNWGKCLDLLHTWYTLDLHQWGTSVCLHWRVGVTHSPPTNVADLKSLTKLACRPTLLVWAFFCGSFAHSHTCWEGSSTSCRNFGFFRPKR